MQQRRFGNTFAATLLAGLLVMCLAASALAGVNARLDRDRVYEGDPVTLTIETDGQHAGEPDLAALNNDFNVLGTSTSTRISIINGRRSDTMSWTVQLEPRHKGTLRIPPISVGGEQTRPLELEVTDIPEQVTAGQSAHVFLEVEADTDGQGLYVQQQIPYTVRLYYDERVLNGELQAPQPEQAVVEQLGEDKQYSVTRNARRYNVIERRYAISPQKSGPLQIPPAAFKGQIASAQNAPAPGPGRLFDRFFRGSPFTNDPFFSNTPFASRGQPIRVRSEAIDLDVQPRPASAGNTWLPAEQITLQDSWADRPPQFRAGEPVTRTITLQAKGLSGAQLPGLQAEQPAHTRIYPETPVNESRTDGDKVYGISKQSFTYIAETAGMLTIPAVELGWWNTRTNQADSTRLPQWEINVEPGSGGTQPPPAGKPENKVQAAAEKPAAYTQTAPASRPGQFKSYWIWPLAAGALLLLVIVLLVAKQRRNTGTATSAVKQELPGARDTRATIKGLILQLDNACTMNDAGAAAHTLLELGRARWQDDPPRNLGALVERLGQGQAQIMALDRALYAADSNKWNGTELWNDLKDTWHKRPAEKNTVADSLKPLYPYSN